MKKKFKQLEPKKRERIRKIIRQALTDALREVERKTGYYTQVEFLLMEDEMRKTNEIEIDIALIERPHDYEEIKVKHYMKVNPDKCLDEPIIVYHYDSWYKIYNGVHRTEANRRLGKEKIKAKVIVPDEEHKKEYNKNDYT